MTNKEISALIKRRRAQVLVHSCIYYEMDDNIISDDQWQKWANELAELQNNHPKESKIKFYDRHFYNWDGTSGVFLPLKEEWVWNKALYILDLHRNNTGTSYENI